MLSAQIALGRLIENDAVAPTGEDPTTVDLLTRLDQAPENRLRAVELSRQLLLSPSHISRTIDKAEAGGLVVRGADPDDRRASQVTITSAGREVLERFAPRLEAIIDRVIGQTLSRAESDTLIELLGRIQAAAREPFTD
jgi:DNA-binding MarR family transcriptional regulator